MDSAITLRDVTKQFSGSTSPAVDGLSMDIAAGAITVLVGPSGCGKTTVLRMINRLTEPTRGQVLVNGTDVRSMPVHELRRGIGYVIQQTGLFPHRTVAANIATVPGLLGWNRTRTNQRVAELAELVGLAPDLLDRYPAALSGGQQQRVGVARALAADPPVLLMDEPYSAVDPIVRQHLQDELLDLQARVGKTIVLVTHDVDEATRLADQLAVVNVGGRLEQYATPTEVLRHPATPFVERFMGAERGLRQLGLLTVADTALADAVVVTPDDPAPAVAAALAGAGATWAVVVDGPTLVGWVSADSVDTPGAQPTPLPTVTPTTTVRQALDAVLTSPVLAAAVVHDSVFTGVVTVDTLTAGLR